MSKKTRKLYNEYITVLWNAVPTCIQLNEFKDAIRRYVTGHIKYATIEGAYDYPCYCEFISDYFDNIDVEEMKKGIEIICGCKLDTLFVFDMIKRVEVRYREELMNNFFNRKYN